MAINDYSSLIGLVATLSIAFVATEYVTSYTKNLCERFFKFQEFVVTAFRECRDVLTDKETLNHITAVDIGGKSTNSQIEEAKRKNESLTKKIDELENEKKQDVANMCQARSMSALCLFLFLENVFLLFLGSIEPRFDAVARNVASWLCIFSALYVLLGWLLGEKENLIKVLNFSSLCHAVYSFVFIFIVSLVVGILGCLSSITAYWWWLLLVSIILSFFNFVVFVLKVKGKANDFKKDVENARNEMKKECEVAEKDVRDLMATSRLSEKLNATPLVS